MTAEVSWERAARAKQASISGPVPVEWRIKSADLPPVSTLRDVSYFIRRYLSARELEITDITAEKILKKLGAGEWTALEVNRAFCHRAAIAHQLIFFKSAEKRAEQLDEHFALYGRTVGPLHGLPVSLKDRFRVEGIETACGYVGWLGRKEDASRESRLVKKLKHLGAILFVKTNVPMSLLMGETCNNIIGSTCNPHNRSLSAGGASGGEGALLALRGSPLGWGTDIAGSIRIPCAFNSLYGLRPSHGRLPAGDLSPVLGGLPAASSVIGPMSPDLTSLELAIKAILSTCPWEEDHQVICLPWAQDKLRQVQELSCADGKKNGKLAFGIMNWDGNVNPHPPVQRAMRLVADALEEKGYEIIKWKPPPHSPAVDVLASLRSLFGFYLLTWNKLQMFGSTGCHKVREAIDSSREPPVQQLGNWYQDQRMEMLSTAEFWDLCQQREDYRSEYLRYWNDTKNLTRTKWPVDGVILPVAPSAAVEENHFTYFAYPAIANVLDYTTGRFPVTFADASLDPKEGHYQPCNWEDQLVWQSYRADLFDGAPVGLQVMGRRLEEEKVIGIMKAIAGALQQYTGRSQT